MKKNNAFVLELKNKIIEICDKINIDFGKEEIVEEIKQLHLK